MTARVKDLLVKAGASILFWALCKNRKMLFAVAKKIVASLTLKELLSISFDIKDAIKHVK